MEQQLKQRIVGAVVLVSLAVIFVPMLFEERSEIGDTSISQTNVPEFPKKRFESGVLPLPDNKEIERKSQVSEYKPSDEAPVGKKPVRDNHPNSVPIEAKIPPAWVIQVGSFGKNSNAEAMAKKLMKSGFPAFVESKMENNSLIHRVWVGPELDQERTELAKSKIEKKFKLKAIILPYKKQI